MHPGFVDLLRCPVTQERLSLRVDRESSNGMVERGMLMTQSGREYPIIRGIPRFVSSERYASSFGYEWNRWPRAQFEAENIGRPMEGHTTRMFERITEAHPGRIDGKTIVEFGCGPGRFLDVVRRKGGIAVGVDMSQAVDVARRNFADDSNVLIVQGDVLRPPFARGVFDGGYSIGVLHHTPDPAAGVRALAGVIRQGGWIGVCVYTRGKFYDYASVKRVREAHLRLKRSFGYGPALAYAWLSAGVISPVLQRLKRFAKLKGAVEHLEQNWIVSLGLKDRRWRFLDIFDAITPEIASTHDEEELLSWLGEAGCEDARRTAFCATSATGTAGSAAGSAMPVQCAA